MIEPRIIPYGDAALLLQYDVDGFSMDVSRRVQGLSQSLQDGDTWEEVVAGYDSILVSFDQTLMTMDEAHRKLKNKAAKVVAAAHPQGKVVEIPVHYGGEQGPDMGNIVASSGLSEAEVIALHSSQEYLVCMMGFIPGFAFLSEAPKALHHPRRAEPRLSVPAGSVGIAGWQTGVYGLESPGGWQIIGRTSLKMFDKNRAEPFAAKAGDLIRFVPFDGPAS